MMAAVSSFRMVGKKERLEKLPLAKPTLSWAAVPLLKAAYPNMTTTGVPKLYQCDFFNSTAAGNKLGNVLKLGGSVPWQQQMQMLTGSPQMSAAPLLEYFQPLTDWLTVSALLSNLCF